MTWNSAQDARQSNWTGLVCLLYVVGYLLAGCSGEASRAMETAGDALVLTRGTVAPVVLLTGELVAEDSIPLAVPNVNMWPVTLRWIVEEGDEVAEGDAVVEFDNSQLASNLETLRSQVVTAGNTLAQTRAKASSDRAGAFFDLEEKKAAWEKARLTAAQPKELSSEQEWARLQLELHKAALEKEKSEKALAATESASQASIDIERLALQKAELALARAERGLSALTIQAPRAGVVQVADNPREDRPFRAGDNTWPGILVASLPKLTSLYVEASLFDVDDGRVEAGSEVIASLDAFSGEILHGTVRSVAAFAQETGRSSSRRAFQVVVDLEGLDPVRMRPGMSVKLEVRAKPEEGLVAPRSALVLSRQGAEIRLADGSRQPVEVGACDLFHCLVQGAEDGARLARSDVEERP